MASTVTTFAVFTALLQRSVQLDANLDAPTKASIMTRLQNLPREQEVVLDQGKALSVTGNATENVVTRSIDISAVTGTSRVEYDPMQFFVPLRIDGTKGIGGFMPGHAGTSVRALVAQEDLSIQYKLASSDPWSDFDRSTVLDEVTWVQFAANVATQSAIGSVPAIHIHAEQV